MVGGARAGLAVLLLALCGLAAGMAARADQVAQVRPPSLDGTPLTLAGCAERRILMLDVYALSLFLPKRGLSEAAVFDPRTPKSVRLRVTYFGDVPGDMPKAWRARFEEHRLPPAMIAALSGIYQNLSNGDVLGVDYDPRKGSVLRVNDQPYMVDKDHALINALLDIWMGPRALNKEIRAQLMSGNC